VAEAKESASTSSKASSGGEEVEFIDLGDRTLVIDNRGAVQRRDIIPKSSRDIGVSAAVRQELEERIEADVSAAKEAAEADPKVNLPPVESDEDIAKREKAAAEAIAKADEAAAAPPES
jgi:hypothetical protein